jgi:hypothetical protein
MQKRSSAIFLERGTLIEITTVVFHRILDFNGTGFLSGPFYFA